jgi:hypothetical protein
MKDSHWQYSERSTRVSIDTPPHCFGFEGSSEATSECEDGYTLQGSPIVSPSAKEAGNRRSFAGDSAGTLRWPQTPEAQDFSAEVQEHPPRLPRIEKLKGREGRPTRKMKSLLGKGKSTLAIRGPGLRTVSLECPLEAFPLLEGSDHTLQNILRCLRGQRGQMRVSVTISLSPS